MVKATKYTTGGREPSFPTRFARMLKGKAIDRQICHFGIMRHIGNSDTEENKDASEITTLIPLSQYDLLYHVFVRNGFVVGAYVKGLQRPTALMLGETFVSSHDKQTNRIARDTLVFLDTQGNILSS